MTGMNWYGTYETTCVWKSKFYYKFCLFVAAFGLKPLKWLEFRNEWGPEYLLWSLTWVFVILDQAKSMTANYTYKPCNPNRQKKKTLKVRQNRANCVCAFVLYIDQFYQALLLMFFLLKYHSGVDQGDLIAGHGCQGSGFNCPIQHEHYSSTVWSLSTHISHMISLQ